MCIRDSLNAGKESVACDLKREPQLGRALCSRADVVLVSFRPGVAERLGVGLGELPASVVWCSITGFGSDSPQSARAGHDLNYLGYAGALADTARSLPPVQIADLAAGALGAVTQILAALLERAGGEVGDLHRRERGCCVRKGSRIAEVVQIVARSS